MTASTVVHSGRLPVRPTAPFHALPKLGAQRNYTIPHVCIVAHQPRIATLHRGDYTASTRLPDRIASSGLVPSAGARKAHSRPGIRLGINRRRSLAGGTVSGDQGSPYRRGAEPVRGRWEQREPEPGCQKMLDGDASRLDALR